MQPRADVKTQPSPRAEAVAFLARLIRLQREMRDVGRRLDRIESEYKQTLNELARGRQGEVDR
jgi:hypothetical protein